jgi:hypothetical protein
MKISMMTPPMSQVEAQDWIDQVGGVVYHNEESDEPENAWVAVVRTPGPGGQAGKIILAFGESPEDATGAAEEQWDEIWDGLSAIH